jgi:hypothetical protein
MRAEADRSFGLFCWQCGLTMRGEWPDRSEDEKLETWPNALERAIIQEQEPKAPQFYIRRSSRPMT